MANTTLIEIADKIILNAKQIPDAGLCIDYLRGSVKDAPLLKQVVIERLTNAKMAELSECQRIAEQLREVPLSGKAVVDAKALHRITTKSTLDENSKKELKLVQAKCAEIRKRVQDKVDDVDTAIFDTVEEIRQHIEERITDGK